MDLKFKIGATHYRFRDPVLCREAIAGFLNSAGRYRKKAEEYETVAAKLQVEMDKGLAEDKAKAEAKKAAKSV